MKDSKTVASLFMALALAQGSTLAQEAPTLRGAEAAAPVSASRMAGATTLLVQDELPWGYDSNEQVLTALGVAYDTVASADFASVDLSAYSTIIVASTQPQQFYGRLKAHRDALDNWLKHGARTLEFHAAFQSDNHWGFDLPGQVHAVWNPQSTNALTWVPDPLTAGLPHRMTGNYASHVTFQRPHVINLAVLIRTVGGEHDPVMVDYCVGSGRVIATGQTVEFAYANGWDFAPALQNMLAASTLTPGCQ